MKLIEIVTETGRTVFWACKQVGINYTTARDIMEWYMKTGMPYRSAWDQDRMENPKKPKEPTAKRPI